MSFLDKIKELPKPYDKITGQEALKEHSSKFSGKTWESLLLAIFGNSPYLSRLFGKHQQLILKLESKEIEDLILDEINNVESIDATNISKPALMNNLRVAKQRISLLIAIADISNVIDLEQTTKFLSDFADTALLKTTDFLTTKAVKEKLFSKATDNSYFVLALGKLGGKELNYSSDIDLVVLYDAENANYKGKISIQKFYINFTNELIEILEKFTLDGYVFRVDLRLRPDPLSTPVAVAVKSAIQYYQSIGQNWERSAMIKQRFVCGNNKLYSFFNVKLQQFIWRKYLDYSALQDIHSIKRQINAKQNYKPDSLLEHNVKTGKGGIREVEFYVQVQQLIWGGKNSKLTGNQTIETLEQLEQAKHISSNAKKELTESYIFLRDLEHRLQMVSDQKTHSIPPLQKNAEAIAIFMGYNNYSEFATYCTERLKQVQYYYAQLFAEQGQLSKDGNLVFTGVNHDDETLATIKAMGFSQPENISEIIRGWHFGRLRTTRTKSAREVLTEITPILLSKFGKSSFSDLAFSRFDMFMGNTSSGMQLFSLFKNKPEVIDVFAQIMGGSFILSETLSRAPKLVFSILTNKYKSPLKRIKIKLDNKDSESLRQWKNQMFFENGIRFIHKTITPDESQLHLTNTAELVIKSIYQDMVDKQEIDDNFCIIALGKFGTKELTYGSDLDLIFVYDNLANPDYKQNKNNQFAMRFIKELEHQSLNGRLYKVDMRLRPYGEDGNLVCSLTQFANYYNNSAWVWELLALTKGRVVAGNKQFSKKLDDTMNALHTEKRDHAKLVKDTLNIRARVAKEKYKSNIWDIKNIEGGLFDLELMIQFAILANSHNVEQLAKANNREIISILQQNKLIDNQLAKKLQEIHLFYKDLQAVLRLILKENVFNEKEASLSIKTQISNLLGYNSFNKLKEDINCNLNFIKNVFFDFINK